MRAVLAIFLLGAIGPLFAESHPSAGRQGLALAQNSAAESAFDPFIDYGEFQDKVAEEESLQFFQHGRYLTISLHGGYSALTMNMRQIYGDTPFLGASLSFFLDLRFAFQVSGAFPSGHYNSLYNAFFPFSHFGVDLKYYLNRQYVTKEAVFFNPYIIFGPFWLNIKYQLPPSATSAPIPIGAAPPSQNPRAAQANISAEERQALSSYNSAGLKAGLGIEFPLVKQSFIGVEISYLYTVLYHEDEDLSQLNLPPPPRSSPSQTLMERVRFPNRPQVKGYRFFGDLAHLIILFGVNF